MGISVVICTDLLGKELHRQVGVRIVVTPRSLHGVIVSTLVQNVRDVDSIHALGKIFPIFRSPMTHLTNVMCSIKYLYKYYYGNLLYSLMSWTRTCHPNLAH